MPNDYWIKFSKSYKKCTNCRGSGYTNCSSCNGKGGKYIKTYDYDFNGNKQIQERWQACSSCSGTRIQPCYFCAETGSIQTGNKAGGKSPIYTKKQTSSPKHTYSSNRDQYKIEFDSIKSELLQRIADTNELHPFYKNTLLIQLKYIHVDTPTASKQLSNTKKYLDENYGSSNFEVTMISSNLLRMSTQAFLYKTSK